MFKNAVNIKRKSKKRISAGLLAVLVLCLLMSAGITGCSSSDESSTVVSTGVSGTGSTPTDSDTLRVGVRSDISGFSFYNEIAGKFTGLEIDIATEAASRLGYSKVEYLVTTPETKEDMLINGDVDCVIACYSITDSREEAVDFSPSYYVDTSVVMVEQSALFFNDIDDLAGCTFGVREGTNTAEQLVTRLQEEGMTDGEIISYDENNSVYYYDNFRIKEYSTYQEVSDALERGDVDAFCADGCIARAYSEDNRKLLDFQIATQQYGAATLKGSALSEPVYETIGEMKDDGTISELIDKWD